ncbi:MAG: glycoside hydrolase family 3 N-terminal domain-containing protein [Longimonas sp.]|uniref:glycoside hydrolase family 3 N-terminal domain-containing protein n=1 Tax=Longimonas sp. TaxID=2039626 RepID=UPI0033573B0F
MPMYRVTTSGMFSGAFVSTLLLVLAFGFITVAGCTQTQPSADSTSPSDETQADSPSMSSNELSQTGELASAEGALMPLDRSVSLLDIGPRLVSSQSTSSQVFIDQAVAQGSERQASNIEARVDSLLDLMTLEEKVGQMTQFELGMVTDDDPFPQPINQEELQRVVRDYHVGSLLNVVDTAFPLDHWHEIIGAVQEEARQTRLGIPVLYGIDAMHGANYTQEAILFPQAQGLAATWNVHLVEEVGAITARDVRASGIPWNFAPVLDAGRDLRWPRLYETFGEDAHLTTAMGLAINKAQQGDDMSGERQVASTLKHFIGYSVSDSGRDRTPATISEIELREQHLPPFEAAIDAGAASVMVNSGEVNGVPVHSSHYLLTDVLRGELGFDGLILTDWLDIKKLVSLHHVAADEREATKMAIEAGIDMSMVPSDVSFIEHLTSLVEDGEITESRIDESVRRILRLKFELGLFEDPMAGIELADEVGSDRDRQVALQAAHESVTLLRNEDDLLPLSEDQNVLVTGPTSHSMQSLNNGWTYTWQGGGRAQDLFHEGRPTVMEAVRERVGEAQMTYMPGSTLTRLDQIDEAVDAAHEADVAIVALGEGAYTETAGNLQHSLMLPEAQRRLLQEVAATGTPVVLVLLQGRPRTLGVAHEAADAIVTAYNPGTEGGQAVVDVLYGDVNPSGHLPHTYPSRPTGYALYDHKHSERLDAEFGTDGATPLFPFGHGLSYTTFDYSDLTVSETSLSTGALHEGEEVEVEVTITNTGDRAGSDVVQLYMSQEFASVTPSVRKLKRFAKVDLEPGSSETLTFQLTWDDFSFIGRDARPVVESGPFTIQVDSLDAEITLTGAPTSNAALLPRVEQAVQPEPSASM